MFWGGEGCELNSSLWLWRFLKGRKGLSHKQETRHLTKKPAWHLNFPFGIFLIFLFPPPMWIFKQKQEKFPQALITQEDFFF